MVYLRAGANARWFLCALVLFVGVVDGGVAQAASAEAVIVKTVHTFLDAEANGAGKRACQLLTNAAQRQLVVAHNLTATRASKVQTCAQAVDEDAPHGIQKQALLKASVHNVIARSNNASAEVTGGVTAGKTVRIQLRKQSGKWLLTTNITG